MATLMVFPTASTTFSPTIYVLSNLLFQLSSNDECVVRNLEMMSIGMVDIGYLVFP